MLYYNFLGLFLSWLATLSLRNSSPKYNNADVHLYWILSKNLRNLQPNAHLRNNAQYHITTNCRVKKTTLESTLKYMQIQ